MRVNLSKFQIISFLFLWLLTLESSGFIYNSISRQIKTEDLFIDSIQLIIRSWNIENQITLADQLIKLDLLLDESNRLFGERSKSSAFLFHKKGVVFHNLGYKGVLGSFDSAIIEYEYALNIRLKLYQIPNSELFSDIINGYSMIGICYSRKNNQLSSLEYLKKGLKFIDQIEHNETLINIVLKLYTQTARTYNNIGDYDQSIKFYKRIIHYPNTNYNDAIEATINNWKIIAFKELGGLYANQLYYPEKSFDYFNEAQLLLNTRSNDFKLARLPDLFIKKGNAFYRLGEYDSSYFYYKQSTKMYNSSQSIYTLGETFMNLGATFNKLSILDSGIIYLKKAIQIFKGTSQEYKLASVYDNYGDLELKRGDFIKSLEYDNLSLSYMIAGYNTVYIFDNPSILSRSISDKMGVLISLSSKAETFTRLYLEDNNEEYLMAAYTTFRLADQVIGMMRSEFQAESSRMSLASYAKPIYEQGIEACYLLYQLQPHDSLLNKAFEFAEKSKAIVLLDAVRKTNARAHVAPELIQTEKAMNLKVTFFEKQAALYEQDSSNRTSYNVYDSLLYYRRQHQDAVYQIKETTPEYYSLIYDQATTSPAAIQQNLSKDQAFIEYFLGDSSLYTFTFTRDKTIFNKYENPDSIKTWANKWVKTIPSMNQDFIVPAHQLYSGLIEPLEHLNVLPKNLIIVPDDVLNLVNFEALVTELPSGERMYFPDFKDYMIFDHTISYAFSASTLEETRNTSHTSKKTYLGIAPTMNEGFYQRDHWFDKLDYNQEEVLYAASLFPKKNVIEKPSAKDDFLELAPSYGLIHCATHAMANNKDGDLSFIALGQDESDIIYAKDIYALDLDAALVVLSACQTSAGELNRGEGIISLARSFAYAGAASVVTSLWNVREKANKEIIYDFYNLLKHGKPKDEALRSAKLNYLKNINRDNHMNAHPYFWATMVVIGDTSPLQASLQLALIILIVFVLLFVTVLYVRYRQKQIKNQTSY